MPPDVKDLCSGIPGLPNMDFEHKKILDANERVLAALTKPRVVEVDIGRLCSNLHILPNSDLSPVRNIKSLVDKKIELGGNTGKEEFVNMSNITIKDILIFVLVVGILVYIMTPDHNNKSLGGFSIGSYDPNLYPSEITSL